MKKISLWTIGVLSATIVLFSQDDDTFFTKPLDPKICTPTMAREIYNPKTRLRYIDIAEGLGRKSESKLRHYIRYVLYVGSEKRMVDSSYSSQRLFSFTRDSNEVIEGLSLGMEGMKEGGRRFLEIPPALAYGEKGRVNHGIPRNAMLSFEVELVKVSEE